MCKTLQPLCYIPWDTLTGAWDPNKPTDVANYNLGNSSTPHVLTQYRDRECYTSQSYCDVSGAYDDLYRCGACTSDLLKTSEMHTRQSKSIQNGGRTLYCEECCKCSSDDKTAFMALARWSSSKDDMVIRLMAGYWHYVYGSMNGYPMSFGN